MIVKICKNHGELTRSMVYQQYSKHKDKIGNIKIYPYFQCKICVSDKKKRLYYANHEKCKEYGLMQRNKHWGKRIESDRKYKRERLINDSEYSAMYEKQNGLCAICNKTETAKSHKHRTVANTFCEPTFKRLSIDHNHNSGQVRGLLCGKCNTALGLLKDSTEILNSAIRYLSYYEDCCVHEDVTTP